MFNGSAFGDGWPTLNYKWVKSYNYMRRGASCGFFVITHHAIDMKVMPHNILTEGFYDPSGWWKIFQIFGYYHLKLPFFLIA